MARKSKHGCRPSPYGKRTKLWWAMLSYDERKELWHLERAESFYDYYSGTYICGYCKKHTQLRRYAKYTDVRGDLCKVCWERWELLVAKASLQSEHVRNVLTEK